MKTTMLDKMLPPPMIDKLYILGICGAHVGALDLATAKANRKVGECDHAANRAAEAKEWEKVLQAIAEGDTWRQAIADAIPAALENAKIVAEAMAWIEQSPKVRNAISTGMLPKAVMNWIKGMDADVRRAERRVKDRATIGPSGLEILEGMARLNLGRPIPRNGASRKHGGSERACGQRVARKAVRQ